MELREYFEQNSRVALAYSGGVDSTYLLYAAIEAGADVTAYYVKSVFQPEFEYREAMEYADAMGAKVRVLDFDVLADENIAANPEDRCYWCKKQIMGSILAAAESDGYKVLIDGTNASDDAGARPGMRALTELEVRSPLRLAGLTKAEVRRLSRAAKLPGWDKPAYACLATRIASGERITERRLEIVEEAEDYLMKLGFDDLRVRTSGSSALIQVKGSQFDKLEAQKEEIFAEFSKHFDSVSIDSNTRGEMEI